MLVRMRWPTWYSLGFLQVTGSRFVSTFCLVSESPDKPNITYEAVRKNTIEEDFSSVVRDLAERNIKARRVVVYCQFLDMCASLSVYEIINFWHVCDVLHFINK